jgi:hypothetical protein
MPHTGIAANNALFQSFLVATGAEHSDVAGGGGAAVRQQQYNINIIVNIVIVMDCFCLQSHTC